jgi:hypothetical protein
MAGALTISTLNNDTGVLATQNGMSGIPKAWVNFNGTGTVAINGSFNVSSITDNGTGDYTVNFTTAMPNANYSFQCNGLWAFADPNASVSVVSPKMNNGGINPVATSSIRIMTQLNNDGLNSFRDFIQVSVAILSS